MRRVEASLDKIFAFGLRDEGLKLCGSECVNETRLRHDKQEDLGASERRKLIGLLQNY
jgi:hypothetical protein